MKIKYLLLLFFVAFKLPAFAQNKIVKYCEVVTSERGFSAGNIVVTFSIGKIDSLFSPKDPNIKSQLQKLTTFKTASDILNYMSSIGWSFINVTSIATSGSNRYYFKREFDSSELNATKTQ